MKLCIDCKHYEAAEPLKWWELFDRHFPGRFQDKCNNAGVDMVTGQPTQGIAHWMRQEYSPCGPIADRFEPK